MKTYTITDVATQLGIDRKTLRRWIREGQVPRPIPGIVNGRLAKIWTESGMAKIREYKVKGYWGKGIDRKTGKRAKGKRV